jgi:hypothetical protein
LSPGILLIVGSLVFVVGAAVGVPGVFTERDPEVRLRMLTERRRTWRAAQPLYALGPIVAAAGVGFLAAETTDGRARTALTGACVALLIGSLAWAWSVYLRSTRIAEFAHGTLPGWPFATYVLLTIGGLALLGLGLVIGDFARWLGWLTLVADAVFLVTYLRFRDLPPFVFYLLLLLVGVVVY